MYSANKNTMVYLNGKYIDFEENNEEPEHKNEEPEDNNENLIIERTDYKNNSFLKDITDIIKLYLFNIFWYFLGIYTNIDLYFNKKKILVDSKNNKLVKNGNFNFYKNNELIASNKYLTNRKNYDIALCEYKDNNNIKYYEVVLPHNKKKQKHKIICDKHFMSVYFTKDDNEYELKMDDENFNLYLVGNIIDYNTIKYLMFYNYNIDISNIKFNVVIIDNNSDVIILNETNYIKLFAHRYSINDYTE